MLRSCLSWGNRGPFTTHAAPAFVSNHQSVVVKCFRPSSRQPNLVTPSLNNSVRALSSSSTSSFEAPEPPKSQGQPVFPDIQFRSSSSEEEHVATNRNADPEAVFVVNGSNRGIGLQFVTSLLERTKVCIVSSKNGILPHTSVLS